MLSNGRAGRSKRRMVALLLEVAACGGAIGFFGCSSASDSSAPPGNNSVPNTSTTCGNGMVDGAEQCDGNNIGAQSCASATMGAFPLGTLKCAASCVFD